MNIFIYIYTLLSLAVLDAVWLLSTGELYKKWLGDLFAPTVNFIPAIIFYLVYAAGLSYFAIMPALKGGTSTLTLFLTGAFFGFVAYATYDLTNNATLRGWPTHVTLIDLAWGALLSGAVSVIVLTIYNYFK